MSSELKIGEYLKQVREEQGYTLQDVSDAVNVRKGQLRAIEEGRIDELPGKIYGVGFVKSYAAFLDLDAEAAANQFKLEHYAQAPPQETEETTRKKQQQEKLIAGEHDNRVPGMVVIVLAVAFLMACLAGWQYFRADDTNVQQLLNHIPDAPEREEAAFVPLPITALVPETDMETEYSETEDAPAVVTETAIAEASAAMDMPISSPPAPAPEQEPARTESAVSQPRAEESAARPSLRLNETAELQRRGNDSRVVLRAHTDSWINITDDTGRSLFQRVLRPGDEYFVPNQAGLVMATGNAGGLNIYVDGERLAPIGQSGDIMRGVSLEPDSLKARRSLNQRNRR